jgi:hypothetical protein
MAPVAKQQTLYGTRHLGACNVVVLWAFLGSTPFDVDERRVGYAVISALERSGMIVGLASASGDDYGDVERARLAVALEAAAEEGSGSGGSGDGSGGNGGGGSGGGDGDGDGDGDRSSDASDASKCVRSRIKALVVVGLGASGPRPCQAFLNDRVLRTALRRFAQHGGVVLLHGRGGAVDEVFQGWFEKQWASGVPKAGGAVQVEFSS